MKIIDIETWDRKNHYLWFSSFADPSMALDVKMNVTDLIKHCKAEGLSSFATIMYIVCDCLNQNKNMRLRIIDNNVVDVESANAAYTVLTKDGTFINCRAETNRGFAYFHNKVKSNKEYWENHHIVQKEFNTTTIIDDIYFSCLPWVNFLSVRQPIPDMSAENKSIPRVCWGQYYKENERFFMTMNITANHALADGYDLANCIGEIQKTLSDKKYLQHLNVSKEG